MVQKCQHRQSTPPATSGQRTIRPYQAGLHLIPKGKEHKDRPGTLNPNAQEPVFLTYIAVLEPIYPEKQYRNRS